MDGIQLIRWSIHRRSAFRRPVEVYNDFFLLCAEEGVFRYAVGEGEGGEAGFGDLVFCAPGLPLRREMRTPFVTFFVAAFTVEAGAGGLPAGFAVPSGKVAARDTRRLASTFAGFQQLRPSQNPNGWAAHLFADLLYLAAPAPPPRRDAAQNSPDALMNEAARRLRQGKDSSETTADVNAVAPTLYALAERLHLSPSQFTRRFEAAFGVAPSEYQAALRTERACALLLETDWTLERIATACGYRDGFYLSRVFRKRMGLSPSAYRKGARV